MSAEEVLSVVTAGIGDGPFNLVVEEDVLFSDHLDVRSSISIHMDQLRLDDLTIHTADAKLWNPRPDWERLHGNRENLLNQLKNLQITDYLKRNGFPGPTTVRAASTPVRDGRTGDTLLDDHSEVLNHQHISITNSLTLRQVQGKSPISNLSTAIVAADISSALTMASQLAGLGIGLTPSGDDFLLGVVLATWIIHPPEIAKPLAKEITNVAAPLTTTLSAAWLRSAGRGDAGTLWHDFFDALFLGDPGAIQLQINRLLSIGHTSGADALAGFIGTFLSYAEAEAKLCHS